jgi:predicted nuclease of predicted toxin-antitoxin system
LEIWNFARRNNLCIVTFDADFIDLSTLKGSPPKIIWLRFGNTSTTGIAQKMIENTDKIIDFMKSDSSDFFVVI